MKWICSLILLAVSSLSGENNQEQHENYVIGPGDQILIDVIDAEELVELTGKSLQVSSDGFLNVPTVGRIYASGLTVEKLQAAITERLKRYVRDPRVVLNVTSVKSQSVSVIGAVRNPGVQMLEGPKTVAQALAVAGGLSQDAGFQVKITRDRRWGAIPLQNAQPDASNLYSTAEIRARDLTDATNPKDNILVRPNDVITVPRAQLVYVVGEVRKPGGFTLGEYSTVSILQALALAEGLTPTAAPKKAHVLRAVRGSTMRTETSVNLAQLFKAQTPDMDLNAGDILVVPNNASKKAGLKILETTLQTVSGLIIYRGL